MLSSTAATQLEEQAAKALVGSEFTLTVSADGKVTKVDGREDFVKKLTSANPQMGPLLQQILSDDALKQMADPTFAAVPNNADTYRILSQQLAALSDVTATNGFWRDTAAARTPADGTSA